MSYTNEYDIFTICKNRLEDLLKNNQVGNSRYIFVVDRFEIAEFLLSMKYGVIYIENNEHLNEIIEILHSNYWTNNTIIIGCCYKNVNTAIGNAVGSKSYISTGWKIYNSKKEYYCLHPDELNNNIENFIKSIDGSSTPHLNYDSQSGLIDAKNTAYREIASYVIEKYNIFLIDDELMIKKVRCIYEQYTPRINDNILINEVNTSTKNYRSEVYQYIIHLAPKAVLTKNCIPFENGVYDMNDKKLIPYEKDMFFNFYINHKYNPNALFDLESGKTADTFFNNISCDDNNIYNLLVDIIAYCFIENNPFQKMFFLYGTGGNGKGVFFELIDYIFGSDNVAYKNWEELSTPQGRLNIIGKKVVLCDDINDTYVKEPQALKTLISCEPQTVKRLYQDEFTATFRGKIISSGNAIPRVNDTSNGWQRRLILIPFEADFRSKPDVNMAKKLTTEPVTEYIIALAIERLPKVMTKGFTPPTRVEELIEDYRLENNPVAQFIESEGDKFKGIENGKVLDTIWIMYKNYCFENGYKPKAKIPFSKDAKVAGLIKARKTPSEPFIYYI